VIETLKALVTDPSYPSLHVVVVHFPIAFVWLALVFDFGCMIFRSRVWLDRAATALYVMASVGAGAAYLAGERAAETLAGLSPAAESALADHESSAVLTLIGLSVVSLVRLAVSWLARNDRRVHIGIYRIAAIPVALAAVVLLSITADRGGNLVYGHGFGVKTPAVEQPPPP
jgi:uncharacterized membrane protein